MPAGDTYTRIVSVANGHFYAVPLRAMERVVLSQKKITHIRCHHPEVAEEAIDLMRVILQCMAKTPTQGVPQEIYTGSRGVQDNYNFTLNFLAAGYGNLHNQTGDFLFRCHNVGLRIVLHDDANGEAGTYGELVRNARHHLVNRNGSKRLASVLCFFSVAMVVMFGTELSGARLMNAKWPHFMREILIRESVEDNNFELVSVVGSYLSYLRHCVAVDGFLQERPREGQ